jgi:hypothetical protein
MILTMYPMVPITMKPIPTAREIWRNSLLSAVQLLVSGTPVLAVTHTLCAPVHELCAISHELLGDLEDLGELVGHCGRLCTVGSGDGEGAGFLVVESGLRLA